MKFKLKLLECQINNKELKGKALTKFRSNYRNLLINLNNNLITRQLLVVFALSHTKLLGVQLTKITLDYYSSYLSKKTLKELDD